MAIKAVIFDMDGVICDTNPYHSLAFDKFFEKRGLQPTKEDYENHMFGKPNSYIFSYFLGRSISGEELKDLEEEKEGLFRGIYAENVEPIKGFIELIEFLKEKNLKLGVATSAPRANFDLIIDTLGIRGYFSSTLSSEDVIHHKPNPEVYLKSAKNLGVEPQECLVFEDSSSGINAAIKAGCNVIGILTSHKEEELPRCSSYARDYTGMIEKIKGLI